MTGNPGAQWIARILRTGDLLVAAQGVGEPTELIDAVLHSSHLPPEVELFVGLSHSEALKDGNCAPVPLVSFGALGPLAAAASSGRLSVIPCHFSDLPRALDVRAPGRLVLLVQVAPPDEDGYHSLGVAVDYTWELIATARAVIAEINDQVPVTSAPRVHRSAFAATVSSSRPLPEVRSPQVNEIHHRIARKVARLVEDGSTVQLGIGTLAAAVGQALTDRRQLRVHSVLAGEWLLALARSGALSQDPKSITISEAAGSSALYDHVVSHDVAFRAVDDVMRYVTTQRIERFVAINAALEVDLTGQVNAEQLETGYVGAIGGQPEFLRAGHLSPAGKSIVMLPSTAGNGAKSRIVRQLQGNTVTTPRSVVDFVVTEHGVADLRGKTLTARAEALAAVAAPEHRAGLSLR